MKDIFFNKDVREKVFDAFSKNWVGYVSLATLGYGISIYFFFNIFFFFWKEPFLPFHEKSLLNIILDMLFFPPNFYIFQFIFLFSVFQFLDLFWNSIYIVFSSIFGMIWSIWGDVFQGHGHASHDSRDWDGIVLFTNFSFRAISFTVSSEVTFILLLLAYSFGFIYLINDVATCWWGLGLLLGSILYWRLAKEVRKMLAIKRMKISEAQSLVRFTIYLFTIWVLGFLPYVFDEKAKNNINNYFNSSTSVYACTTNNECFEGNLLKLNTREYIFKLQEKVIIVPHGSMKYLEKRIK